MLSLQRHFILILYYTISRCTSDTNTTIYISTTSQSIFPTNIYTSSPISSQSKSIFDTIIHYEVDGLNLIFLLICAILLLCTFCCVFGYFICQHSRRKRMLKEQIAANTPKHKHSNGKDINIPLNNESKDINIPIPTHNNNTSNTMTSSFDNHTHKNSNHNQIPQYNESNNNNNNNNFGIGSPKHHLHTEISPINAINSHSHISSPNDAISPQQIPSEHEHKNGKNNPITNGHNNQTNHVQVPSNLAAEMEMASFIPMGMDMNINNNKDDTTTDTNTDTQSTGVVTDDEKKQLKQNNYPSPATKKMRSFSRRTASLDNFKKKIAYDDMEQDPELAQYVPQNDVGKGKGAYKISNVGIEESDDSEEDSSSSSDDSTDDDSDSDDSDDSTTTEGSDNDTDSDSDSDDTDQSEDGGQYDTTTGNIIENFGKNVMQKHLQLNNNNKKKDNEQEQEHEHEQKINELDDGNNKIDIIKPIKFKINKKVPKKHHVKDTSDASSFGSYDMNNGNYLKD